MLNSDSAPACRVRAWQGLRVKAWEGDLVKVSILFYGVGFCHRGTEITEAAKPRLATR